jgi:hypothetical protein
VAALTGNENSNANLSEEHLMAAKKKAAKKAPVSKKKKAKRTTAKKKAKPKSRRAILPDKIYAQASPRSVGGSSMFDAVAPITEADFLQYTSEASVTQRAVAALQSAGFEVLHVGACSINIAASANVYEKAFGIRLYEEERPVIKERGRETTAGFIDSVDAARPGLIDPGKCNLLDVIEGIAIEEPRYFFAPHAFAPNTAYWHLRVPGDVSLATNADKAHRAGYTGKNVKVVMVDSGWYRHPYFEQRGYRSAPVVLGPGTSDATRDTNGHGTGESANAFAVAPDIDFTMVKINFANSTGAFNAAVDLDPHIISCSWGSSIRFGPLSPANQALAAAIATAVARGICVVFSAGNGHWGFPGQHPDVISAGGVYMEPDGTMQASDYSSGFASNIYAGRNVPDVSGLVGMNDPDPVQTRSPGAMYIMLPLEESASIDVGQFNGGANHYRSPGATPPFGDETARDDGWAVFSGTSAAAPQLAGVCALVKQACGRLTPAQVRDILKQTARDVTVGNCSPNTGANPAAPGPDLATGHGLVDAHRAAMLARLRCLPIIPRQPVIPRQPITVQPRQPITPVSPVRPITPIAPVRPVTPVSPIRPSPIGPGGGIAEGMETSGLSEEQIAAMGESAGALSEEDLAALEEMIVSGDLEY